MDTAGFMRTKDARRMSWRMLAAAILAGLGAAAWALPAVDIVAGFDGYYRPGRWTPVVVTLNNQPAKSASGAAPPAFRGLLAVPSQSDSDPSSKYNFVREIEVPAFSIQRYCLYAKFPESASFSPFLELRTSNGRLLQTFPLPVNPIPSGNTLLLTVSEELIPFLIPTLPGLELITRANSSPDRLPEQWWGYESAGVVVLTRWSETYLRPAQEQALEQWVNFGGTVVLLMGGAPDSWKGGLMDRLLPGKVLGSERIRIRDGEFMRLRDPSEPTTPNDLITAVVQSDTDCEILSDLDGLPLVMQARRGNGKVVAIALDAQTNPELLSRWFMPMWRELIPYAPLTSAEITARSDLRGNLPIVSARAARPPNIFLILLLLVAYVVSVGPMNFRMLSRRRKLEWAWITVPVIVLIFSLLIYGLGVLTKGGQLIAREASWIVAQAGHPTGSLEGLVGIFSPEKMRYSARPKDTTLALAESDLWNHAAESELRRSFRMFQPVSLGRQSASGLLGFGDSRTILRTEETGQIVAERPVGQWDVAFLETLGLVDLEGSLDAPLTWRGDQLFGRIKNNTSRTLRHPILVHGRRAFPLKRDLLPGDEFTLDPGRAVFPASPGAASPWVDIQATLENEVSNSPLAKTAEQKRALEICQYIAYYQFQPALTSGIFPPRGGETWLLAFGTETEAPVEFSKKPDLFTHSTCYAFRLFPKVERGRWTVTEEQMQYDLLTYSGTGQVYFTDNQQLEIYNADCILSVALPFQDPRIRVESIDLKVSSPPGAPPRFTVSAMNMETRRWDPVTAADFSMNPHRYVMPISGRMFVRISNQQPLNQPTLIRETAVVNSIAARYVISAP